MTDEDTRILTALGGIEGADVVTAWPREPGLIPVVMLTLAGESAADRRDDRIYLIEYEYYVRVFAAKAADLRRVRAAVDDVMDSLGYACVLRWDEPGDGWRQTAMRYRIYL